MASLLDGVEGGKRFETWPLKLKLQLQLSREQQRKGLCLYHVLLILVLSFWRTSQLWLERWSTVLRDEF